MADFCECEIVLRSLDEPLTARDALMLMDWLAIRMCMDRVQMVQLFFCRSSESIDPCFQCSQSRSSRLVDAINAPSFNGSMVDDNHVEVTSHP